MKLAQIMADTSVPPTVTAEVRAALEALGHRLEVAKTGDPADLVQARYLSGLILNRSRDDLTALAEADRKRALAPPPGMPIGAEGGEDGWFSEALSRWN